MPTRKPAARRRKAKKSAVETAARHPPRPPLSKADAAAEQRLRAICLALPDVIEKIAWGEPTWRAGKIFAQMDSHHHGAEHVAVWLPANPGVQQELVHEDPVHYFVPPYVGHKGWIGVRIDRKPDWRVVAGLVADAYRLVAPPHLLARLDANRDGPARGWRAAWLERGADDVEE